MKKHYWLIIILAVGILLRFYHNTGISLWHDEAFSALLIKYGWGEMLYRIGLDVHPPMYYIFLRVWHYVLGDSLLSLRAFSVFFSLGGIWAGWLFVKTAFKNQKAALWAAALIAVNPFQIQYATEARMYTLGAFFGLLAAYFLVKALNFEIAVNQDATLRMPNLPQTRQDRKKMIWNYAGFAASSVIMIYTHYYLLFAAAAIGVYGAAYLFFHRRLALKAWLPFCISCALILISYLPWLKIFLFQYRQVGAGYWIPPMDKWSIPSTLYTLLAGFSHDVSQLGVRKLLIAVSAASICIGWSFLKKTQSFHKWLVLLIGAAPFFGSVLFLILARLKGSGSSVYLVRYFVFTASFLTVMVAVWLAQIKYKWLAFALFALYLSLNALAFANYWQGVNIKQRPGMNGAVKYLKANLEPGHKVYSATSFEFFNLKYYAYRLAFGEKPLLFSGGISEARRLPHFAGTAILTDEDLLPDFRRDVKSGDTVWVVWTNGFGSGKPEIPDSWVQIAEKEYPEVRPYLSASVFVSEYKVN